MSASEEKFLLRREDGAYLTSDFETWSPDIEQAHLFIRGAALNACIEELRRDDVSVLLYHTPESS